MSQQPYKIPGLAGMNNRLPDFKNRVGDKHFARSAVNVDLTDAQTMRRRKGTTLITAGDDSHSLWASKTDAFYVDYKSLYRLDENAARTELLDNLVAGRRVSFASLPDGSTVAMNGVSAHWLVPGDDTPRPWRVPTPASTPILSSLTGGSMNAGTYQVVYTLKDEWGREGPATQAVAIDLTAGSRLVISGIQVPSGYTAEIYLTPANGDIFFRAPSWAFTGGDVIFSLMPALTMRCPTLLLDNVPYGNIVRQNNGRVFTAVGPMLYYTDPYSLCYNPLKGFIPFPDDITMMEPCGDGLYVAADQTYWLGGDIENADLTPVLPYGAVAGAGSGTDTDTNVWWMSTRGIVVGNENGQAKNVQEAEVAVSPGQVGATLFREQDGVRQLIASVFGGRATVAAASTWMEAEIGRRETVL